MQDNTVHLFDGYKPTFLLEDAARKGLCICYPRTFEGIVLVVFAFVPFKIYCLFPSYLYELLVLIVIS